MQWCDCLCDILTQQRLIDDKWTGVCVVYKTRKFTIVCNPNLVILQNNICTIFRYNSYKNS